MNLYQFIGDLYLYQAFRMSLWCRRSSFEFLRRKCVFCLRLLRRRSREKKGHVRLVDPATMLLKCTESVLQPSHPVMITLCRGSVLNLLNEHPPDSIIASISRDVRRNSCYLWGRILQGGGRGACFVDESF